MRLDFLIMKFRVEINSLTVSIAVVVARCKFFHFKSLNNATIQFVILIHSFLFVIIQLHCAIIQSFFGLLNFQIHAALAPIVNQSLVNLFPQFHEFPYYYDYVYGYSSDRASVFEHLLFAFYVN